MSSNTHTNSFGADFFTKAPKTRTSIEICLVFSHSGRVVALRLKKLLLNFFLVSLMTVIYCTSGAFVELDFDMTLHFYEKLVKVVEQQNKSWRETYELSLPQMMTAIRRKACLKEVDTNCDGNSC
jgi:exonuclease III